MIIRGLAGVLIGAAYGLLIGTIVFLLTRIGLDRKPSGMLILDPVGMAWLATVLAGLIAAVSGMLVGLIVGLSGVNKRKAATIGVGAGLLVLGLLALDVIMTLSPSSLIPASLADWFSLFVTLAILLVGLPLMSMIVAVVAARLKPYDL